MDDSAAMRALIEALPSPVWARDDAGKLAFVNPAYARAVEAKDAAEAVERGIELFDQRRAQRAVARARAGRALCAGGCRPWSRAAPQLPTCITVPARARQRRHRHRRDRGGACMRAELSRMMDAHRRTLDQLATGVAIFGSDQRLTFYNTAYRSLWDLDAALPRPGPTDSAVLDQLRAARKLPDEQDFRQWKSAAARGLPRARGQEHDLAPAGRPHHARRHHAQSRRRRDLPVRRRHRAARPRAPLRRADPRAGRDARQPGRGGRGVRQRRPAAAATIRSFARMWRLDPPDARRAARTSRP